MRCCVPEGKALKDCAHPRYFIDFRLGKRRNTYSSSWCADGKALGFQPAKSFPDGDMACLKLLSDVVLPQFCAWQQYTGDNAIGQNSAYALRDSVVD